MCRICGRDIMDTVLQMNAKNLLLKSLNDHISTNAKDLFDPEQIYIKPKLAVDPIYEIVNRDDEYGIQRKTRSKK